MRNVPRLAVWARAFLAAALLALAAPSAAAQSADVEDRVGADDVPELWYYEWPRTDFSRHSVGLDEIVSGGPPKDGIPPIDEPVFVQADAARHLDPREPVIGLIINGDARAYPIQVLIWHEIVNDTVGGRPVAITYCPLCNAAAVFDRRVNGHVLDFGTTGKLRHSDLIMYDRQTESWWQQFVGEAIIGAYTGARLDLVPARLESLERFRARVEKAGLSDSAKVLVPNNPAARRYGANPYVGYDGRKTPYPGFFDGDMPTGIAPLERVVTVDGRAWSVRYLARRGEITDGDLVLRWSPGQASALDKPLIAAGADIGNVTVQRKTEDGLVDVPYGVDFAFAFHAFFPKAEIIVE